MYKSSTKGRSFVATFGGPFGTILFFLIIVLVFFIVFLLIQKAIKQAVLEKNDFYRFNRLLRTYMYTTRATKNFTAQQVQIYMDQFEFNNILLPLGDKQANKTWDTDSEVFGELCVTMQNMLSFVVDRTSNYYKNELLWQQILFSIRTISNKLPQKPTDYKVPWGTNWYQFSITYPIYLVSAAFSYADMYNRNEPFLTRHLASYIQNYFADPPKNTMGMYSMGWLRDGPNVCGMSVPLIGGRLYSNRFNSEVTSQQYVRNFLKTDWVYSGNGTYYDDSFLFHVSRNDGYTTSFYYETVLVYNFYRMNTRIWKTLDRKFALTEHPIFPYHHAPWFSRTGNQNGFGPGRQLAKFGLGIRGFEKAICLRTKEVSLQFNGQQSPIAAYESDRVNKAWAQAWVFMRRPITRDTNGPLYEQLVPYYDGVHSYGLKQIDWPSLTTTTTTFVPNNVTSSIVCFGDVAAGLYNKFQITMADQFKFDIEELTLVTLNGLHCFYKYKPNPSTASLSPYTIACRLGKLEKTQTNITGVAAGTAKRFDNFLACFVYLDDIDAANSANVIKMGQVTNPQDQTQLDAMYIQPRLQATVECGFTNMFYPYNDADEDDTENVPVRHNELVTAPTISQIESSRFLLQTATEMPGLLMLHDLQKNTCVISYAYNTELPRSLEIKKSVLDKYMSAYTPTDSVFVESKRLYTVNTYEKQFQIVLKNVVRI